MSYNKVPEDFLAGVFLSPHSFSDPENPEHGQYVNLQLRNDLYYSTLEEIAKVEFQAVNLAGAEEWVKVEKMEECRQPIQWYGQYSDRYKKRKGRTLEEKGELRVDQLSCQDWHITYHKGEQATTSIYQVHTFQSQTDIFKTQIYPPTLFKTLKDLLLN
jgi:hypothetical protein